MTPGRAGGGRRQRPPPAADPVADPVTDLVRLRIQRALSRRSRYKYVQARVEREGKGWKIVSPNCSRKVDPRGGDIAIAWLLPREPGHWQLYARDHARQAWRLASEGLSLQAALDQVCQDPLRLYWP